MTQIISRQMNYEEDSWDDIEIPETGLPLINNDNDYGLSTTTRDMSEITIYDSSDDDLEDYDLDRANYNSSKSTPASSSSSIDKVKEMMINSGVVITNNEEEFSGLITRIGGENNKVVAVGDDWDNDIEIPKDGLANLTFSTNKKNNSFNALDNNEQDTTTKSSIISPKKLIIKQVKDPLKIFSKSSTVRSKKALESVDDDFDFSGVDLNKLDLSTKAIKLHHREEEGNLNDKDPFDSERLSSRNSSRLSILPSPAPTNGSQSAFESGEEDDDSFDDIQFPERMDSLTLISYNDDNDFENGFDIGDENVFNLDKLKNKNIITRPNPTQQKRTRRESFTIEFNTSPKNSRSSTPSIPLTNNKVSPKTANDNSPQVSPLNKLKTDKAFSKSLTSLKTRTPTPTKNTTKTTFPKNQINLPKNSQSPKNPKLPVSGLIKKSISSISLVNHNTLERSKSTSSANSSKSKKTATSNSTPPLNKRIESNSKRNHNKKRYQQNINSNKTYNNNPPHTASNINLTTTYVPEIMRKPTRKQSFGDGTELDGFDDLPINIDRERPYTSSNYDTHGRNNSVSSVGSKTDNCDNLQHHRKHKKNRKRKKPHLIRNLNADMNRKVVGEMVYNPTTQRWDGNDSVLKDFDNALTSPTRPALISNMNNRATNTKSFQIVGKMKFDPTKMCWNNYSSDEEEEILARFDCDDDRDGFIYIPQAFIDDSDNDMSSASIKKTRLRTKQRDSNSTGGDSSDFQVGSEFDITSGFLAALLASERQHRNEITRWYPDALSKKNNSRFGLRDITLQRSYLYDLRNNNKGNTNYSSSSKSSKINHNNRSGGLFEAAKNLTRHERRHFR